MSYVGLYDDTGIRIVGPFPDEKTAAAWGEPREDPRWFVLPDVETADYGMVEDRAVDTPFVAVELVAPGDAPG